MLLSGRHVSRGGRPFVHEAFESHAARRPGAPALTCGPRALTYGELNTRANRLARFLRERGVGPGSVVGVCLDRSLEMMVGILATLKAGAAYAPLDTTYPTARLQLMFSQVPEMKLVLAAPETWEIAGAGEAVAELVDVTRAEAACAGLSGADLRLELDPRDLCYVVFTSGSTGTPKATAVRHDGWYNLLAWCAADFELGPHSSGLLLSPFGFDITQRGLMTPLLTGAVLHLLPSRNFDGMLATRLIRELKVRTLHCAPSALYVLMGRAEDGAEQALRSVDYVFVGGEAIAPAKVAGWAELAHRDSRLVNVYGVAECTDVATFHVLTDYAGYAEAGVPIGRPIHNIDVRLVEDDLSPVAPGEIGELCISGIGVGEGYLNDPGLTAERFVRLGAVDPETGEQTRLYRTGDLARVSPAGELMYVGRADSQVKIRGMRVDLGDIETALCVDPRISQAVVVPERDGGRVVGIAAYVVPEPGSAAAFDARAVRADLLTRVPAHMVPGRFGVVADFPLSPNGKVDRNALAARAAAGAAAAGIR